MTAPSLLSILGIDLEVKHIPLDKTLALENRAPSCVFLHEGLGSVALWKDWPVQICQSLGCEGWVYSRQGYGESESITDVRGTAVQTLYAIAYRSQHAFNLVVLAFSEREFQMGV